MSILLLVLESLHMILVFFFRLLLHNISNKVVIFIYYNGQICSNDESIIFECEHSKSFSIDEDIIFFKTFSILHFNFFKSSFFLTSL